MGIDEIYKLYFKDVYLYILGLSSNKIIAEDITQETFLKAIKTIDSFDGKKDIRAWLFTIAKNTYFTLYKREKIYIGKEPLNNTNDDRINLVENLVNEESAFLIHNFLHKMKEPYKEVFNLRVFGELSFDKIGMIFAKSDSWARVTYYRAKKMIIKYMEEIEEDERM